MRKTFLTGCMSAITLLSAATLAVDEDRPADIFPQASVQAPLAAQSLLTDVVAIPGGGWAVVGSRGHILLSTDGLRWQQAAVPVQALLTSVYFVDAQFGWAVGHDATILHTQDGGNSWQLQQFLPELDKPLLDVYFFDRQRGMAIGAYGMFYTTSDGGQQWEKAFYLSLASEDDQEFLAELAETDPEAYLLERESVLPHFNRLIVEDEQLFMVGESGFIANSKDAGLSWQRLEDFYNGSFFDLTRTASGTLLVVGLRGNVFRSEDEGMSWDDIEIPSRATINSVFTRANGDVYLVGNAGALLRSQDDGLTFQDFSQADGRAILNGLALGEQLMLVTEAGVKQITLSKSE